MVGDACYKNPPLFFISADAGVRKFRIGWAVMSNLLACILACILWETAMQALSKCVLLAYALEDQKLLQSCSNFTLKPELKPTVTACLAGRDAQEVFTLDLSKTERRFKAIAILARLSNADIHKIAFSAKTYTVIPSWMNF